MAPESLTLQINAYARTGKIIGLSFSGTELSGVSSFDTIVKLLTKGWLYLTVGNVSERTQTRLLLTPQDEGFFATLHLTPEDFKAISFGGTFEYPIEGIKVLGTGIVFWLCKLRVIPCTAE